MLRQSPEIPFCSVTPFDPTPLWDAANQTHEELLAPVKARRRAMLLAAGVAVTLEAATALALTFS